MGINLDGSTCYVEESQYMVANITCVRPKLTAKNQFFIRALLCVPEQIIAMVLLITGLSEPCYNKNTC